MGVGVGVGVGAGVGVGVETGVDDGVGAGVGVLDPPPPLEGGLEGAGIGGGVVGMFTPKTKSNRCGSTLKLTFLLISLCHASFAIIRTSSPLCATLDTSIDQFPSFTVAAKD